jgi:hypothetical protein
LSRERDLLREDTKHGERDLLREDTKHGERLKQKIEEYKQYFD